MHRSVSRFVAFGLSGLVVTAALAPSDAAAATYKVDNAHTQIGFKVKHLGLSNVSGLFKDFEGTIEFDPANIKASKAHGKIKANSVDTEIQKRDDHLRSDDFFGVEKHPEITFVSKEIKNINGNKFTVLGDLTIRDVTKPVELQAEYNGSAKDPWGNERAAFSADTTINRKDFGLTYNQLLETGGLVVGDDVKIHLEVEGIKQ